MRLVKKQLKHTLLRIERGISRVWVMTGRRVGDITIFTVTF
jgi:hypothetical protein